MKIRSGFVSNSSSTSFILDSRDPDVKQLLFNIAKMRSIGSDLGRFTGSAIGYNVQLHVDQYDKFMEDSWYAEWLEKYINELGVDNVVLVRESDEGMSGYLSDYGMNFQQIRKLAVAEIDYH